MSASDRTERLTDDAAPVPGLVGCLGDERTLGGTRETSLSDFSPARNLRPDAMRRGDFTILIAAPWTGLRS